MRKLDMFEFGFTCLLSSSPMASWADKNSTALNDVPPEINLLCYSPVYILLWLWLTKLVSRHIKICLWKELMCFPVQSTRKTMSVMLRRSISRGLCSALNLFFFPRQPKGNHEQSCKHCGYASHICLWTNSISAAVSNICYSAQWSWL